MASKNEIPETRRVSIIGQSIEMTAIANGKSALMKETKTTSETTKTK